MARSAALTQSFLIQAAELAQPPLLEALYRAGALEVGVLHGLADLAEDQQLLFLRGLGLPRAEEHIADFLALITLAARLAVKRLRSHADLGWLRGAVPGDAPPLLHAPPPAADPGLARWPGAARRPADPRPDARACR